MTTPSSAGGSRQPLLLLAAIAVLLALVAAYLLGDRPATADAADSGSDARSPGRSITTSGKGTATGVPDQLEFTVGVTLTRDEVAAATKDAGAAMDRVLAALRKAGVGKRDLRTTQVSINPKLSHRDKEQRIVGYTATHRARVTVPELHTAGAALAAAARAGGNDVRISGVVMGFAHPEALIEQARTDAIKDARAGAEQFADAAGADLGPVVTVTDAEVPEARTTLGALATQVAMSNLATRDFSISPGEKDVTVKVTTVWSLR